MFTAAFIIAEYNPFHNGHAYNIECAKCCGADAVICIMSGNFVQRGEPSYFEKHIRAKAALLNGADLVLELPLKYAVSDAGSFAYGGIKTAVKTGLKGKVCFGASAENSDLLKISQCLNRNAAEEEINAISKISGKSYPSARAEYVKKELGEKYSELLSDGNNTLALCYINEIINQDAVLSPFVVKRTQNVLHDSKITAGKFASAGYLRDEISKFYGNTEQQLSAIKKYIPENLISLYKRELLNQNAPYSKTKYNAAALSRLYTLQTEDFLKLHNVNQGLENRFIDALNTVTSLEELYDSVKVKRFTHSRVRQITLSAVLGITENDLSSDLSYIRVLGFNAAGREVLKKIKDNGAPVIENISQAVNNPLMQRDASLDISSTRFFELIKEKPGHGNAEFTNKPVVL